jgi:hypothetical protein
MFMLFVALLQCILNDVDEPLQERASTFYPSLLISYFCSRFPKVYVIECYTAIHYTHKNLR